MDLVFYVYSSMSGRKIFTLCEKKINFRVDRDKWGLVIVEVTEATREY